LASVTQVELNGATPQAAITGNVRYSVDGAAITTQYPVTAYSYDNAGNLIEIANPNATNTHYTYNIRAA
jgi:YD repeat-containing protein